MVGHAKSQDQKQHENSQNHEEAEAIAYGIELHREDEAKPENE